MCNMQPSDNQLDAHQHQNSTAPLKRAMSTRHLVMLSLGGAIGTGLFLGSGKSFHKLELLAQLLPIFLVARSLTWSCFA